jgi:NCS2 family nucleobase:cation symporter-2
MKPSTLIYGVDEQPPFGLALLLALQHLAMVPMTFVIAGLVAQVAGCGDADRFVLYTFSMVAVGVATALQALRGSSLGSGFLCPAIGGPAFWGASVMAAQLGGLPLVFGMTLLAGLFQAALTRLLPRLRALFPPEVVGLVVLMVALSGIRVVVTRFFGATHGQALHRPSFLVATLTFAAMAAAVILGPRRWRLFAVLIGLAAGAPVAWYLGLAHPDKVARVFAEPWFALPAAGRVGLAFDARVAFAFGLAALASTLKVVADLAICQRSNDEAWTRLDLESVGRGALGLGTANVLAGLLGSVGVSTSSGGVGLSVAMGATSRVIGLLAGLLTVALAFSPKAVAALDAFPDPLVAACMLFAISYMIVAGFQLIVSRMLDARKTFVVGVSLSFGLSVEMMPGDFAAMPTWLHPFFDSGLTVATVLAVLLNLVFRLGVSRKAGLTLASGEAGADPVFQFLEAQGAAWGARREIIQQAAAAAAELVESLRAGGLARGPIRIEAVFDDFNLRLNLRYEGEPPALTSVPKSDVEGAVNEWPADLTGRLVRRHAREVKVESRSGVCVVNLSFRH